MAFIYVTEQGSVLQKTGERLIVSKDDETLLDIPAAKVEGVMIFGNVQFTTQAVRLMFDQGIELGILTRRGKFLGRLSSPITKNIILRQKQYQRKNDIDFSLSTAKTILSGKLNNCIQVVREFGYNHTEKDLKHDIEQMALLFDKVSSQPNLQSLLGIEGSSAQIYFTAYGKMILRSFQFTGRRKRPAPDPINALLSLGYTLVYNEIESLLDGMGFDPYLGFYHQPRYGHATLASDLMEEFRAPLIDRFTLLLINNNIMKEEDFYFHKPSGGMFLTDKARNRYFAEYERFVTKDMVMPKENKQTSYRVLFKIQAESFKKAVMDKLEYVPYYFSWR